MSVEKHVLHVPKKKTLHSKSVKRGFKETKIPIKNSPQTLKTSRRILFGRNGMFDAQV